MTPHVPVSGSSESPVHPPSPTPMVSSPVSLPPPEPTPPPTPTPPHPAPLQDSEEVSFIATSLRSPPAKKHKPLPPPEIPYGALDPMKYHHRTPIQLIPRDLDCILLCTHDMGLPDIPTLHTRMLLVAWELELDGVTENAADLLMLALKVCPRESGGSCMLLIVMSNFL